jgi:ribosomal protein L28
MNPKYKTQLNKAKSHRKENKNFLANLGKKKNLDQLFHPRHEEVFSRVDCLQCANCCKTTSPIFRIILIMSRICEITGKSTITGNRVSHSNIKTEKPVVNPTRICSIGVSGWKKKSVG